MQTLNEALIKLGISKVNLAKYLGVSRQMVYNYLDFKDIDKWPKDKQVLLFQLLNITEYNEKNLIEKVQDKNYVFEVNKRLNSVLKTSNDFESYFDISDLNKEDKELIVNIINLMKEILSEGTDKNYDAIRYLYYLLQSMENVEEIKYILGYVAKANGFIRVDEFSFDEDKQFVFEGILYSALNLYSSGGTGVSKTKIAESRRRFVEELEHKAEEKLSRTQQLFSIKDQALKELGYKDFNDINADEFLEKIAEIESRRI